MCSYDLSVFRLHQSLGTRSPGCDPPQRPRQTLSSSSVRPRSPSLSQYWANFLAHRRGFNLRRRNWRRGRASRSLSTPLESTSSWLKCHRSATSGLEDSTGAAGEASRVEVEEVGVLKDVDGELEGGDKTKRLKWHQFKGAVHWKSDMSIMYCTWMQKILALAWILLSHHEK